MQTEPPTCTTPTCDRPGDRLDPNAYDWVEAVLDSPEPVLSFQVAQDIMERPGTSGDWFARFRRSGGL